MATTRTRASAAEAALHWTVAALVVVLLLTGVVMYVPALSELVGNRFWVRTSHLAAAVALTLAPLLFAALRPRRLQALERELSLWQPEDVAWFTRPFQTLLGGSPRPSGPPPRLSRALSRPAGERFNGGQKLFAALAALGLAVLLLTGVPMYWWGWFSAQVVARARDLHVVAAFALTALLLGHVYLALLSPFGLLQRRLAK